MATEALPAGRLDGKVAIVTGGGGGIGGAMAKALHAAGAYVVVVDISGREAEVAAVLGSGAIAMSVDVTSEESVAAMVRRTTEKFGRLDILCNNAGIDGDVVPLLDCSLKNYDRVMAVNLRGVFLGLLHGIPAMAATGGGSIINTASVTGHVAYPGLGVYAASKAGVIALTRAAAVEYAKDGVRCNAICPGAVMTPLTYALRETEPKIFAEIENHVRTATPLQRFAAPEEMAGLAVYLASDEASYLTGAAIPVDGGYLAA